MGLKDTQVSIAVLVDIGGSYRFTSFDIPVYFSGQKFEPRKIEINGVSQTVVNQVSELSFSIDNIDNFFDSVFSSSEMRGTKVNIYIVALDQNTKVIESYILFSGYIDTYELDKEKLDIGLTDELVFWTKTTLRWHTYDIFPSIKDVEEKPLVWGSKTIGA